MNLLRGKAAQWVTALWEGGSVVLESRASFVREEPASLEQIIIDNCLRERIREKIPHSLPTPRNISLPTWAPTAPPAVPEEPMQMGRSMQVMEECFTCL